MLNLEELLNPKSFLLLQNPTSKKMVFDNICNKAFENLNIDKSYLLNNLIKREKIGSTTIGNGIAIPHIQNEQIIKPSCIVIFTYVVCPEVIHRIKTFYSGISIIGRDSAVPFGVGQACF